MHPIDDAAQKLRAAPSARAEARPPGPPRWLVLGHFAFAAAAFWVFSAGFFLGAPRMVGLDFDARWVLGLVHALTLGWIAMILLGSLLQMASSHGGTALYRPGLATAAWVLLGGGACAFTGLLWAGSDRYWLGAAAAAAGILLYLIVLGRTMARATRRDVTFWHFANALAYLGLLAGAGLALAYDKQRGVLLPNPDGALVAHVHLALVGWVSLSIAGASYRLVPAVAAYRSHSIWPSRVMLVLINLGLLGLAADGVLGRLSWQPLWAVLLCAAYALYAWQALRGPQPPVSPSAVLTYVALAGGGLWAGLGLSLSFGYLFPETGRAAYVFAAAVGWITPHILAQLHKILPFLVWLILSGKIPQESLPAWDELGCPKAAWLQAILLAAAVAVGTVGFLRDSAWLLRSCGGLLLGCATAYLAWLVKIFSYLVPHLRSLREGGACPLAR
ncbi:MAG: hypothetical protein HY921_07570 [Elusimicrobia bacterium]|nr:hypothetical protein [Elusimicrobiota bacterium]